MPWKLSQMRCSACGKAGSPLGHVCGNSGDFGKRRAAAARAAATAGRQRKAAAHREKVRARVAAARTAERAKADSRVAKARTARKPAARPGRPQHPYQSCRDGTASAWPARRSGKAMTTVSAMACR